MNMEIKRFEKEFHDKQGYHYEQRWVAQPRFKHHYERIVRHIKFYLRGKNNIRLVDIGCGTGRGSLPFADTCAHIIGVDISHSLLKIFKAKIKSNHLNNIDLILCDAENLPLRNKIADLVTFFGTLHHLQNKIRALNEASGLLKNEGIISIHEPNKESSKLPWIIGSPIINLLKVLRLKQNKISKTQKSNDISPYETSLTLKEAKSMLLNQDLKILEAKTVWFLGIIPFAMRLPRRTAELYYIVSNATDEPLEKFGLYGNRAGAVFLIAQKSEKCDE